MDTPPPMTAGPVRWIVGAAAGTLDADTGVVALTAADLPAAPAVGVGLHEVMAGTVLPASGQVDVYVPVYRGKGLLAVLSWLAARLAGPGVPVAWHLDKQQGPASVLKLLTAEGWELAAERHGRTTRLVGDPPAQPAEPRPRSFTAQLGKAELEFAADYGVFSPGEVDAGTRLLFDVALDCAPGATVADIGTGYGPLAVGLVRNGIAARALATDVDCIALWLASRNAAAAQVELDVRCSPDPGVLEPTPLTVCNVPTHVTAEQSAALMAALLRRARHGRLLTVVHASLESRYTKYFTGAGFRPDVYPGEAHVVLGAGSAS